MAVKFLERLRRKRPELASTPELVRSPVVPPSVSLNDFTVTVDTAHSGGDRLVLALDRDGEPTLHMQVHIQQFMWLIEDPDQFAAAYSQREHWVDPYAERPPAELAEVTA